MISRLTAVSWAKIVKAFAVKVAAMNQLPDEEEL